MRLTKIKLSGFKSFVDSTTISFPSNLIAIVGPNGCGKSNVIDAIRWVLGEGSAKTLRGDSMADVIFNGSDRRKPVGRASIELVFDNSDGGLGGAYAGYSDLSVRRTVTRDGVSQYYLNNGRCRRKDITQLLLGTGLGSNGYSIIEQGMISRLVEAKPEDLRAFLEEAAGISKYKERRRETENRIGHTRENLERLVDLREEIGKQINHLQRQARAAERYKKLKAEQRRASAELLVLRLASLREEVGTQETELAGKQTALEAALAQQRALESGVEQIRAELSEQNDRFSVFQGDYYRIGAEVARLEQSLQHRQELSQRQSEELATTARHLDEIEGQIAGDLSEIKEIDRLLEQEFGPDLEHTHTDREASARDLAEIEQAMELWRQKRDELARQLAENADDLDSIRGEMQTDLGRLASLEALQEVALGKTVPGVNDWLKAHDLINEPRLGQSLIVKSGWERAVETVLGSYLQAVCVDELDKVAGSLERLSQGGLMLIEQGDSVRAKDLLNGKLLDYVEAPTGVTQLLKNVYVADSLAEAIEIRRDLKIDESVITRDGFWLSSSWLRINRDDDPQVGVLARAEEIDSLNEGLDKARQSLTVVQDRQNSLEEQQSDLESMGAEFKGKLDQAREGLDQKRDSAQELEIKVESCRSSRESATAALQRVYAQRDLLLNRQKELNNEFDTSKEPIGDEGGALEVKLNERLDSETRLTEVRKQMAETDDRLREKQQEVVSREQVVSTARAEVEKMALIVREIQVRAETLTEQLAETSFKLEMLEEELPKDATTEIWESSLESIERRIQRLGAINLAAISEYEEQSERKQYLDAQYKDLNDALETLADSIRKIDRETRSRFKETFDETNRGLNDLFPRLFGGGQAHLELDGEDLLNSGVKVMARPPGKRISTIHLLSGGEKALTAVALVFSIFGLNPAPFCLLDEVDAPLDDANIGRFSEIVREMSQHVQFIIITHNKATMEIMHQLTGVTMNEPGVSRLVAVDIDEAVKMAAV